MKKKKKGKKKEKGKKIMIRTDPWPFLYRRPSKEYRPLCRVQ